MDNFADDADRSWSTPRAAGIALSIAGLFLLVCAVITSPDKVGLVMMAVAGALLIGFGAYALTIRPRLALSLGSEPAIAIRTLRGTHTYTPDRVERIRLLSLRRVGRRVGQLEIDVFADGPTRRADDDSRLIVFSRWDLGTDLVTVMQELEEAGFNVDNDR